MESENHIRDRNSQVGKLCAIQYKGDSFGVGSSQKLMNLTVTE